ncbi:MAG: hypothetical protein K6U78_11620 [Anaerolineae bacterium]|nr:hypothetical protein [Anaerolineae bacterium]
MEHRIPAHVEAFIRPYKPEIDALKYYRCDKLIVVYMALPPRGFDPSVDQALTETCGPAFAHYPTDPSVLTSPIPSPAAPLGFGAPSSGAAPIGPPTTTRDLIAPAQLIVIGEVGPVIQRRTYSGYSSNGQLLDGFNETGMPVPQVPITDFEVKVERVIKDDGTIASGKPIILRMSGNATPEMKATTRNSDYPFSYTGDRHLFLLTRNPDGTTYSFYYGPWSRLLIDSDILRVSNGSQDLLKLDGSDVPIRLDDFIRRVNE